MSQQPKESTTDTPKQTAPTAARSWEEQGDTYFVKKAPFQIPVNGRESLVQFLPFISLVAGLLMVWSAWGLYQIYTTFSDFIAYSSYYTVDRSGLGMSVWLSIAMLVATAVLYFMAFPGLQAHKKSAWKLLVFAEVIYVGYGVLRLITAGDMGTLISTLITAVIGLYLLFQVRPYYK